MYSLPKIHVTVRSDGLIIDFGNGATGRVDHVDGQSIWSLDSPAGASTGLTARDDHAFLALWCRAAALSLPPPVVLDDCGFTIMDGVDMISTREVERLAYGAEVAPVVDTAKVYRRILLQRTGFAWSVRVGSGKLANTITIRSARARQVGGKMSMHDAALLAALTGRDMVTPRNGVTITNTMHSRRAMIHALTGVPERVAAVLTLVAQ